MKNYDVLVSILELRRLIFSHRLPRQFEVVRLDEASTQLGLFQLLLLLLQETNYLCLGTLSSHWKFSRVDLHLWFLLLPR